ncbi:MAG TPA: ABC transporter substrate-binding protein [Candidatus Binatia bacterium]|nr:ABC transporter substrate-binding protein [Candidatus Binatia bacterium]
MKTSADCDPWSVVQFCFALGAWLLAFCFPAWAQQPAKIPRIGLLTWDSPSPPSSPTPFDQGLRQLGYVEGQNIAIERRYANGQLDRLPELAVELARLPLAVILARSFPAAFAAKQATSTIPIVVVGAGDPVATGLVASFARPGGNITGVSAFEAELSGKRLELLKEAFPKLVRVAVLWNAADLGMTLKFREIELAAQALRVAVQASGVREPRDFDGVFSEMIGKRPDALFVITDPLTSLNRKQLVELVTKNRLPAMYETSPYVDAGGLMAYGPSQAENLQRALHHVDKILKGAKPAALPIEQPTKFEFIVSLKAAKQIGLTIPPNVLARADKVIK